MFYLKYQRRAIELESILQEARRITWKAIEPFKECGADGRVEKYEKEPATLS